MKVTVEYYSRLRDLCGVGSEEIELPAAGAPVSELLRLCFLRHAGLGAWQSHLLVAVGVEYVGRNHLLADGDVISLMPPVQGG